MDFSYCRPFLFLRLWVEKLNAYTTESAYKDMIEGIDFQGMARKPEVLPARRMAYVICTIVIFHRQSAACDAINSLR